MTIYNRLTLIISFFMVFIIATVIVSLYIINGKTADVAIIGIAVRQEMLIIKIENETQAIIAHLKSDPPSQKQRQKLKGMMTLFDQNLIALKEGGIIQNNHGANIKLPGSNEPVKTQLGKVQTLWKPVIKALNVILEAQIDITSDKFHYLTNTLNNSWEPLFAESLNSAILLEQASDKKVFHLKVFLFVVLTLTFVVAIVSLYFGKRYIVMPIKMMLKASEKLRSGENDLTNRLPVFSTDEIGQIAEAINEMRDNMHTVYELLRNSHKEALRINQALDNVKTSVLIADNSYNIIYANKAAKQLFQENETQLRQALPYFEANRLLESSIDIFDTHPRELLEALSSTHHTHIVIDNLYIDISINPLINDKKQHLGWVTEFLDRTAEMKTEQEINAAIFAASQGDFQKHIALSHKTGVFKTFSKIMNQMLARDFQMVEELRQVFASMVKGDLTQTMTSSYAGSLEALKTDVNSTITQLTLIMDAIKKTAAIVNNAGFDISQGSFSLSQRTEQQAAALAETVESMEEMTGTVRKNAEHAHQASQLAKDAKEYAQKGRGIVSTVIDAMAEINQSSQQIADIIGVVDEIAFQTNLLALNAAVEAARAGEHGRGFAVVATEVRHLAQRSAEAAKEIKGLIEDSVNKIEEGSLLVNQSGTSLEGIVTTVKKVSDFMSEIAAASQEQSIGIQQVNKALMQMDKVTHQNAILAGELAESSQSMSGQAQMLKNHVAFFKTV
jgi:methyl-accepting chemotaxis protein